MSIIMNFVKSLGKIPYRIPLFVNLKKFWTPSDYFFQSKFILIILVAKALKLGIVSAEFEIIIL